MKYNKKISRVRTARRVRGVARGELVQLDMVRLRPRPSV